MEIRLGTWPVLPVFDLIARLGRVPPDDMLRTFNLGVGMTLVVAPDAVDDVVKHLASQGHKSYPIGEVRVQREAEAASKSDCAWSARAASSVTASDLSMDPC